jgi:hypothetical protein
MSWCEIHARRGSRSPAASYALKSPKNRTLILNSHLTFIEKFLLLFQRAMLLLQRATLLFQRATMQ